MRIKILVFGFCSFVVSAFASPFAGSFMPAPTEPKEIVVHNRPLVRVNNRVISVLDVKKKMDFLILERFPEAYDSQMAKYQFYTENWGQTLDEMLCAELILQEAEELKFTQSEGDVSQELDRRLGTNPLSTLDKLHMKYDEARLIVQRDLVYQQFFWFYVYNKAQQKTRPEAIAQAYESYVETHKRPEMWEYDLITIRGEDLPHIQDVASEIYTSLTGAVKEPEAVTCLLSKVEESAQGVVSISHTQSVEQSDQELSFDTKKILQGLAFDEPSAPLYQTSRSDNSPLFRIYTLRNHTEEEAPSLEEVASEIKNSLLLKELQTFSQSYFGKLKTRYGFDTFDVAEVTKNPGFSLSF